MQIAFISLFDGLKSVVVRWLEILKITIIVLYFGQVAAIVNKTSTLLTILVFAVKYIFHIFFKLYAPKILLPQF